MSDPTSDPTLDSNMDISIGSNTDRRDNSNEIEEEKIVRVPLTRRVSGRQPMYKPTQKQLDALSAGRSIRVKKIQEQKTEMEMIKEQLAELKLIVEGGRDKIRKHKKHHKTKVIMNDLDIENMVPRYQTSTMPLLQPPESRAGQSLPTHQTKSVKIAASGHQNPGFVSLGSEIFGR